ncbi:hypothetical protein ACL00O_21590, partial [Aeromonas sanarellii]
LFLIGDVQQGPSSIVAAIGTARRATDLVLEREHLARQAHTPDLAVADTGDIYRRKGSIAVTLVDKDERSAFVAQEAHRCLECNT